MIRARAVQVVEITGGEAPAAGGDGEPRYFSVPLASASSGGDAEQDASQPKDVHEPHTQHRTKLCCSVLHGSVRLTSHSVVPGATPIAAHTQGVGTCFTQYALRGTRALPQASYLVYAGFLVLTRL